MLKFSIIYASTIPHALLALIFTLGGIPASAQLQKSPADTGRMAWGHSDYSRYTGPDVCDRVTDEIFVDVTRKYDSNTVRSSEIENENTINTPLPPAVIAAVRSCAAKFSVESVDPRELWSLTRISLYLGDKTNATAAIDRILSLDTAIAARAYNLNEAVRIITSVRTQVERMSLAEGYLKKLDALQPAQKINQFRSRISILRYWSKLYQRDSILAHATRAIEFLRTMPAEEQDEVGSAEPYQSLINLANEAGDLALQEKLINQSLEVIGSWRNGSGTQWAAANSLLLDTRKELYGKQTLPLPGKHWFNHNGTPKPVPGKMSLLVKVSHNCNVKCYPLFRLIKQLNAQYGSQIEITLIASTNGFAPGTGPLTIAEEVEKIADYFLKFLSMPAALVVDETPISVIDDGRIVRGNSELAAMFANWNGVNTILVDRGGRIRWLGMLNSKRMIDAAISRVMNNTPDP